MKVPHPLICAYNNEILFSYSFGLAEGILCKKVDFERKPTH